METLKKKANLFVDEHFDHLWKLASYIHADPEIAFEEKKTVHALSLHLQKQGFVVEAEIASLDTVSQTVLKKGNDPRITVFAGYDALKGLGHACGYSLIATNALGHAVAVEQVLESNEPEGSIKVYGAPTEENDGEKTIIFKQSVFDGLDAVFLMYPTSAMVRTGGECASFTNFRIEYFGKSAHIKSHPENDINALDAANLFYQAVGLVRQQLRDSIHICCIIAESKRNIGCIPDYARLEVEISIMRTKDIEIAKQKIINTTEGMALASGCRVSYKEIPGCYKCIPNAVLAELCRQEMLALGEPMMEEMLSDTGGEDLGNISRVIPACSLYMALFPEKKISGHINQLCELTISNAGKHYLDISSKAMANSILTLYRNPKLLKQTREGLKRRQEEEVCYE